MASIITPLHISDGIAQKQTSADARPGADAQGACQGNARRPAKVTPEQRLMNGGRRGGRMSNLRRTIDGRRSVGRKGQRREGEGEAGGEGDGDHRIRLTCALS